MEMSPKCHQRLKRGGRERRETPSKEARGQRRPPGGHGRRRACGHQGGHRQEPGVRTVPPPTPGCSPDTPSTSCRSSPLATPASPTGVAVRLAVPLPSPRSPPCKARSRRQSSSALTVPSPRTDECEARQSQGRLLQSWPDQQRQGETVTSFVLGVMLPMM